MSLPAGIRGTWRYGLNYLLLILVLILAGCVQHAPVYATPSEVPPDATDWPVTTNSGEGTIEIYQPQPEKMAGDQLTARAAVSLTKPGVSVPVFGVIWFTANVITDRDTRTVALAQIDVKKTAFGGSTPDQENEFSQTITAQLATSEFVFPLDELMASLDTAQRERIIEDQHLQNTPPTILFSATPATLISVHGPPRLEAMDGHPGVSRVANTPFILLLDNNTKHYFLKAGPRWVTAVELTGPWDDTTNVPPQVAAAGNELATPATQPATLQTAEISPGAANAKIIVATQPTELIVTNGNPQFTPLPGGGELLYASNTASDVFFDQNNQHYYVLLSGRWYSATSLIGPWQYEVPNQLPDAFAQIPEDSPKADVLPFVAKTAQAHEAVLDAGIPQTAYIRRDAGASLVVSYDGDPKFQDIPECPGVAYALNTPEEVLRVNGVYYCCHQAVWYQSNSPTGPWTVCTSIPQAIYNLPPTCPDYNARYVSIYDVTPDYVTFGYLPGYTGSYIDNGTVVYGTGYDYPGWYGTTYFPPPCTWGFGAYYDPYACDWGFDAGLYWGGVGWFAHPWQQGWWRDHPHENFGWHRWWGPGGFTHSHEIRNNFVNARGQGAFRSQSADNLRARLPGVTDGGAGWHNIYSRGGNVARNAPAAQVHSYQQARAVSGPRDNVFAGSGGSVLRNSNGGWEEHNAGGWSGVDHVPEASPTYRANPGAFSGRSYAPPESGLNQHFAARSQGEYRSSTIRSFGGGGFHGGGGGGFHGGGGGGRR